MIKSCVWKGEKLSCSSIFSMYPTDRGMCCTFNKQKANEMFKRTRFQEQLDRLSGQDKDLSFENSATPPWLVLSPLYYHLLSYTVFINRYDAVPQSGQSKGLVLVLDAHSDLVTGSSISNDFQVNKKLLFELLKII